MGYETVINSFQKKPRGSPLEEDQDVRARFVAELVRWQDRNGGESPELVKVSPENFDALKRHGKATNNPLETSIIIGRGGSERLLIMGVPVEKDQ